MKQELTQQEKKFVCEYIKSLDCETSAKKAGFNCKNLKSFSYNLLKKDYIVREIKKQINQQISNLSVQKGYVIQKLLQIAEFSLTEEDITDKDGNFTGKRKLRDSTAGLKALESLCKYLGFSSAVNNENNYQEAKIITISNLDDEKI